jgi:hypothetical protein
VQPKRSGRERPGTLKKTLKNRRMYLVIIVLEKTAIEFFI